MPQVPPIVMEWLQLENERLKAENAMLRALLADGDRHE